MEDFVEGSFVKYTSNDFLFPDHSRTDKEKLIIDFSHWSYWWTNENIMITDLQGWQIGETRFRLTDPAIHSKKQIFGKTDLGERGSRRYFLFHREMCIIEGIVF